MSNPCSADTDGDGVEDGYEYQSAIDLNDDEYQQPNQILAYPHKMPYPNPGFADADDRLRRRLADARARSTSCGSTRTSVAHDRDAHARAAVATPTACSTRVRTVATAARTTAAACRARAVRRTTTSSEFLDWADGDGYRTVYLQHAARPCTIVGHAPRRSRLDGRTTCATSTSTGCRRRDEFDYFDLDGDGWLSDDERDEDADGLTNYDETHGRMTPGVLAAATDSESRYPSTYAGTKLDDADTDGDGVRDGADDQDHDDLPNMMELSRFAASQLLERHRHGKRCTIDPHASRTTSRPRTRSSTIRPWTHVRPGEPVQPVPAVHATRGPARSYVESAATGAPFDGSPNWYSPRTRRSTVIRCTRGPLDPSGPRSFSGALRLGAAAHEVAEPGVAVGHIDADVAAGGGERGGVGGADAEQQLAPGAREVGGGAGRAVRGRGSRGRGRAGGVEAAGEGGVRGVGRARPRAARRARRRRP